jgi:DNA polymerase beta
MEPMKREPAFPENASDYYDFVSPQSYYQTTLRSVLRKQSDKDSLYDEELAVLFEPLKGKRREITTTSSLRNLTTRLRFAPSSVKKEKKTRKMVTPKNLSNKKKKELKTMTKESLKPMSKSSRYNESFVDLMDQLANLLMRQGEVFRAKAYQKASETIMVFPDDIVSVEQLKGQPGIGPTILEKLQEFVETGTLRLLEREKNNPILLFTDIYGIGPKKAKELATGVKTIEQLRERVKQDPTLLNNVQKVGLRYYEDILKRIPRSEILEYETMFRKSFGVTEFEIVGSYRRGASNSGDIDVIVTSENPNVFKQWIDPLIQAGVIVEVLSRGPTKCLVIAKLNPQADARRVDFLYTTPEEYPFAVLYFTGSKFFNTVMRQHAVTRGYTMNEHGLYKKKGDKVSTVFQTEEDIFRFLGLVYKRPEERKDGRAVLVEDPLDKKQAEDPLDKKQAEDPLANKLTEDPLDKKQAEDPLDKRPRKNKTKKTEPRKKKTIKQKEKKTEEVKQPEVKQPEVKQPEVKQPEVKQPEENPNKKQKKKEIQQALQEFQKQGLSFLKGKKEAELIAMLDLSNEAYRNEAPLITDNEYDILEDYVNETYPNNQRKGLDGQDQTRHGYPKHVERKIHRPIYSIL